MIELLLQAERAMSVGLVDRAEALYTQVAEADPKNSIAVVGLARCALERGDEPGALALARRALVIDPENAAASRMVERLEEVLRYRGQAVAPPEPRSESVAAPAPVETTRLAETTGPVLVATPPPPALRRRSFLDRLLRRNR